MSGELEMARLDLPGDRVDAFGIRGARWTMTSLELPADLAFSDYETVGWALGKIRDTSSWALGDWIRFGEAVYGERYTQAVEATGRSKQTLMNYAWVSGSVPPSRRRPGLSWSHHEAVARLKPQDRDRWLDRAEGDGLSVEELRGLLRAPKNLPTSGDSEASDCEDILEELVSRAHARLRACGYDDVIIELVVSGAGVDYRITSEGMPK